MTDYNEIEVKEENLKKAIDGDEKKTEEREEKKQIVTKVKKRKKGLMERLVVGMLGPDGIPSITSYLGEEIVKPAIKGIIVDSITSGINMAMFGQNERRHTGYGHNVTHKPRTNYAANYSRNNVQQPTLSHNHNSLRKPGTHARSSFVDEYILGDRNEALEVLDALQEQIMTYGTASVADYYDMIGVTSAYTDHKYGWDDLSNAMLAPARNGYVLKLPRAMVIE